MRLMAILCVALVEVGCGGSDKVRLPYVDAPPRLQPVVAACLAIEKSGVVVTFNRSTDEFRVECLL